MKRLLIFLFSKLGYKVCKIPNKVDLTTNIPTTLKNEGIFLSHKKNLNIYEFAETSNPLVKSFKRKLAENTYHLSIHPCPICYCTDFYLTAESLEGFKWGICKECGLLQQYSRLSDTDLSVFYKTGEYSALSMGSLDLKTNFILEYNVQSLVFIDLFEKLNINARSINIVEIGCGSGGILLALKEWGANSVKGFDINKQLINYGKTMLSELEVADALADEFMIVDNCNFVLLSNILEHLNTPQIFLLRLYEKILNSTRVIIDIPNLEYCFSYSNNSFLRFLHIQHLWYFNSITIERMLNNAGFGIEYIFPREAALTIVCSKNDEKIHNTNNAYWNSVSAINYANHCFDPNNISIRADIKLKSLL